MEYLLSLLESLAQASSLTNFKLTWKIATLLLLVITKHCSVLPVLPIEIISAFFHCHATSFVSASGGDMDSLGHFPHQISIESYFSANLCPVFYVKAYL